jgi:hypothetical protein
MRKENGKMVSEVGQRSFTCRRRMFLCKAMAPLVSKHQSLEKLAFIEKKNELFLIKTTNISRSHYFWRNREEVSTTTGT